MCAPKFLFRFENQCYRKGCAVRIGLYQSLKSKLDGWVKGRIFRKVHFLLGNFGIGYPFVLGSEFSVQLRVVKVWVDEANWENKSARRCGTFVYIRRISEMFLCGY